jgi:glycosyltransferase involved in cell wall biosynthesis
MYFKYCNNIKKIQKSKKIKNPKISVISPVYNREKFISRFIGSIQNQNFKDIEIILVDDNSSDNSVKLIENYKREDKRIILIKNKNNRGTFVARNLGVLKSKAQYVIIPDPDDIISKDIIGICYKYGEKYHYDIIRFNLYLGNGKFINENFVKLQKSRRIYQPELSTYVYYGNYGLEIIDFCITNKFIKKKVYIAALNSLNNFYFNMYMTSLEDNLMNYLLYRTAKSLYFIKEIGYKYKRTSQSVTKRLLMISQIQLNFIFIYLKFTFEFSKNSKYEKDMLNHRLTIMNNYFNIKNYLKSIYFNNDFYFYYEVINKIINCIYISDENMNLLKKIKNIIEKRNTTYINNLKKNKFESIKFSRSAFD